MKDYISSNYRLNDKLVDIDKDSFQDIINYLEKIKMYEHELGPYYNNILQSIKISNYSLADKHIIVDYLDRVIKYTDAIIKNYQTIRQDIKGLDNKLTLDQHRSLIHTLYYMLSHNQINIKKSKEVSELFSVVTNYIELRKKTN